ncbi:MAG: methyltransferase family protein [Gammaproteobacteria bacterium]
MQTQPNSATPIASNDKSHAFNRLGGMGYALIAYAIGAGALFWLFFAAGGFAPYGLSAYKADGAGSAIVVNTVLVFLFGLQHTVMARKNFKRWVVRYIPAHLERATFVLMSGITMLTLIWFWQPLPGSLWTVDGALARTGIQMVYIAGIAYVLLTSLITNHFELFGLRQAWLHLIGRPYTALEFKRIWFYRYSRHPMMLGLLMVFWATPDMSFSRFCLAVLLTAYLFAGIRFEEFGLIQEFGERYRDYKKEVGLFFTFNKK